MNKLHPQTQWGWPEVLLNRANYLLETIIWQNGYDPKKKKKAEATKPKLYLPDFMKQAEKTSEINRDSVAMQLHEIDQMLALPRS